MIMEKLKLTIPVQFTIGPETTTRVDGVTEAAQCASLLQYVMFLADRPGKMKYERAMAYVEAIVREIIEGETRVRVSGLCKCLACDSSVGTELTTAQQLRTSSLIVRLEEASARGYSKRA